jgi:hypothetical protein
MLAPVLEDMARFRTRSENSDRRADLTMVLQVIEAVERALNASKSERDGVGRRVSKALSGAAMFVGNGTDEYVEREIADTNLLREYEREIANGRRRLDHFDYAIGQFERLKAELMASFSSVLSMQEH